jgi:hypothetical protein
MRAERRGFCAIECVVTGQLYVGGSTDIDARWVKHLSMLRLGRQHNPNLQALYNAHGPESFRFRVVEDVLDQLDLPTREEHHLQQTDNLVNVVKRTIGYRFPAAS